MHTRRPLKITEGGWKRQDVKELTYCKWYRPSCEEVHSYVVFATNVEEDTILCGK